MNQLKVFIFISSLAVIACKQRDKKSIIIKSDWIQFALPTGWTIYAPKNFSNKSVRGIDSDPGILMSATDSIYLEYDTGIKAFKDKNCDFQESVTNARRKIDSGFYKEFYKVPLLHKAYLDTIDGKLAIIVTPVNAGVGSIDISISDCETGTWLGVSATNLPLEKEKLVLAIYKTIRFRSKQ